MLGPATPRREGSRAQGVPGGARGVSGGCCPAHTRVICGRHGGAQPPALGRAAAGPVRPLSCFQGAAGQRGLLAVPPTPLALRQAGWAAVTSHWLSRPAKSGGFYGDGVPRMGGEAATAQWRMRWGAHAPPRSPAPHQHSPGSDGSPPQPASPSASPQLPPETLRLQSGTPPHPKLLVRSQDKSTLQQSLFEEPRDKCTPASSGA